MQAKLYCCFCRISGHSEKQSLLSTKLVTDDLIISIKVKYKVTNECYKFFPLWRTPEVFWVKGVLKICSKFTGEHPCWSVISIKLLQLSWNYTSAWVFSCKYCSEHLLLRIPLNGCFLKNNLYHGLMLFIVEI